MVVMVVVMNGDAASGDCGGGGHGDSMAVMVVMAPQHSPD